MSNALNKQPKSIQELFTRIATQYDPLNRVLSLGQDLQWRREALALAHLAPGDLLLDVATGTGDVVLEANRYIPDLRIVGTDITPTMVTVARDKAQKQLMEHNIPQPITPPLTNIHWALSDGLELPFEENTFDAVISAFMMRNVADIEQAFREQLRVVRDGGHVVCLEMTWPKQFPMSVLFWGYFFGWVPLAGGLLSGDWEAYSYLPRSVKHFFTPQEVADTMEKVGLKAVSWKTKMFGTVTIHAGSK